MSIEIELQELEKKKYELELQQQKQKGEQLFKKFSSQIGKSYQTISKQQYGFNVRLRKFIDFKTTEFQENDKKYWSICCAYEEITFTVNKKYYDIHEVKYMNYNILNGYSNGDSFILRKNETEISSKFFDETKECICSLSKELITVFTRQKAEAILNGIEFNKIRKIEETENLLDIPHIKLNNNQRWIVNECVFCIGDNYLLTPNSIAHIENIYNNAVNNDKRNSSLLQSYGYRNKHERADNVKLLLDIVKNEAAKQGVL